MKKNITLIFLSLLLCFFILLAADRLTGAIAGPEHHLIHGAGMAGRAHYSTSEFDWKSRINHLGFRGNDVPLEKQKSRIVVLGDSFAYGWGVNDEDTWIRKLENRLRRSGLDVEILNLGKPGSSSFGYAETAKKSIRVLKPDLVLVCILQGNDLAQILESKNPQSAPRHLKPEIPDWENMAMRIAAKAAFIYPNLTRIIRQGHEVRISGQWRKSARALDRRLTKEQRKKWAALNGEIKEMVLTGNLNPALITLALRHPGHARHALALHEDEVQAAVSEMAGHLAAIRKEAEAVNAQAIVLSMPLSAYVSGKNIHSFKRMGFDVDESLLTTDLMDEATRLAAAEAGMVFYSVTAIFREKALEKDLYYLYDGHLNAAGNELLAESIEAIVMDRFRLAASSLE